MRLLIVEPLGGLGNRMRVIDSAAVLAEEIDTRLRVVWTLDKSLAAPFGALFEPAPQIAELVEIDLRGGDRGNARMRRYAESCKPDLTLEQAEIPELAARRFDLRGLGADGTLYLRTWSRFRKVEAPYRMFVPVAGLRTDIELIASRYDETIGVHIRRKDNKTAIATSSTKLFIEEMRRALERAEARSFFLATDDPREQRRLEAVFPGAILSHPKRSLDRLEAVAAEDAVVDLYCLARTKRLIGSYWSSFTDAAAAIGGIPVSSVGRGRGSRRTRLLSKLRSLLRP